MNAETEIKRLENDVKGLKASYPIAASKAKFYVAESQVFDVTGQSVARFRFRPNYGRGKTAFIKLVVNAVWDSDQDQFMRFPPQVNEPQDGSGDIFIKVALRGTTFEISKIKIIASGSTTGTFSQVA